MTRISRRIFFYSVTLAFLFAAPLLTAYTSGYRVDWKTYSLIRLGSIIIETSPREAMVLLNNTLLVSTTPLRISNLRPSSYTIQITKEGYYSWGKEIKVEEGKTNLLVNIPLFRKEKPVLLQEGNIRELNISNSFLFREQLAFIEENDESYEIVLAPLSGESQKILFRQSKKEGIPTLNDFSFNQQFLLVSSPTRWRLIQTQTGEIVEIPYEENPLSTPKIGWDNEKRSVIIKENDTLTRFHPETQSKEILTQKENDFDFDSFSNGKRKDNRYMVYASSNEIFLVDTQEKKRYLLTRGSAEIQKVLPVPKLDYILVLKNNTLTLLELSLGESPLRIPLEIDGIKEIHSFEMSQNGDYLFLATSQGLFRTLLR